MKAHGSVEVAVLLALARTRPNHSGQRQLVRRGLPPESGNGLAQVHHQVLGHCVGALGRCCGRLGSAHGRLPAPTRRTFIIFWHTASSPARLKTAGPVAGSSGAWITVKSGLRLRCARQHPMQSNSENPLTINFG